MILLQLPLWGLAMWNLIPFVSVGLCAAAFAVKIPAEEQLMLDDPAIGPDYAVYKTKVTSRVIPGVW
jgi:protein-S-isoprenylcysteine O-methyltransferase Ste14